jgi:hypothetical protein
MHVTYVGPIDEVEIPVLGIVAPRGKPIEVDPEVGEALCQQGDWQQSNGRRKQNDAETEGGAK